MSANQFTRVVGSLTDAILLSRDRRLLRSIPLFRDSDIEDFEYELLTALIETVHLRIDKEIFVEGDNIDEPALYIVRSGEVEVISEAVRTEEFVLRLCWNRYLSFCPCLLKSCCYLHLVHVIIII